ERRSGNRAHEGDVSAHHFDIFKHVAQITRDCYFLHGIRELSILDPQSDGTTRVIAADGVHTESDQFDDIQSGLYRTNDVFGTMGAAALQIKIRRTDSDDTGSGAAAVACRLRS